MGHPAKKYGGTKNIRSRIRAGGFEPPTTRLMRPPLFQLSYTLVSAGRDMDRRYYIKEE